MQSMLFLRLLRPCMLSVCLFLSLSSFATPRIQSSVAFEESAEDTPNPDRGMFDQFRTDFSDDFSPAFGEYRNHRLMVDLRRFTDRRLPDNLLQRLNSSLERAGKLKQRLVLRFFYDWPSAADIATGLKARSAYTPSPALILTHIRQLSEVIARHPITVSSVESGMIGFWGEQHGDAPEKQTLGFLGNVVDSWRAGLQGTNIIITVRYPRAFELVKRASTVNYNTAPQVKYWNDCLGAIDDHLIDSNPNQLQVFSGETCELKPRVDYSCESMFRLFESVQLNMLHANYYQPTIDGWRLAGCLEVIKKYLGYRYVVKHARLDYSTRRIEFTIRNVGWSGSLISRPLLIQSGNEVIGSSGDLASIAPNSESTFTFDLPISVDLSFPISLATSDGVKFSNTTGNLLMEGSPSGR